MATTRTDLLAHILDAHGGLDRWRAVTSLVVTGRLGGPFWAAKGWPGVYDDQRITLDTRAVDITFEPYPRAGLRSRFRAEPEHLEITEASGDVIEARDRPRGSFPATDPPSPWDAIQTAYFTSCATWNYLTAPFLFTYPGVTSEEIGPWTEPDGSTWRRLAVHFPAHLPNHNPDQLFYFDDAFRLRRLDYRPEVTGAAIAHYTYDHRTFGGILFPTRRMVHTRNPDNSADPDRVPITIAIDDVQVITS